ncbi:MAG TPA: hypothetical protein VF143_01240 [Candidatus Nanopelagicales bacterium]
MRRTMAAVLGGVTLAGAVGLGMAAAATDAGPGGRLAQVLGQLVDQGTITQEQADSVGRALAEARAGDRAELQARAAEHRAELDALLQRTIGKDLDEVRAAVVAGTTLKELAGDQADELADGLVALVEEHGADAVADGRLTQAQADAMVTRARERADAWLAGDTSGPGGGLLGMLAGPGAGMGPGGMGPGGMGAGGMGGGPGSMMGGRMHGGTGGPWWDDDDQAPSSGAASVTSTTGA